MRYYVIETNNNDDNGVKHKPITVQLTENK